MLTAFPFCVFIGILLGFLSGLGTGGGSLLILWLTLVLGVPQAEATAINLMFFIPSALISCLFHWRHGRLNVKKMLPAIFAGSISAMIISLFRTHMDTSVLKTLFGILLLFTGIRELLYKPKSP